MAKKKNVVPDFKNPTSLPEDKDQAQKWQDANRSWWEANPMKYDWKEHIPHKEFDKAFYLEIDRRFFHQSREYLPFKKIPFDKLIPFASLQDKDVLEIGVGNGSHAQLLCQNARHFTGIDITNYAVKSTGARMRCFGLEADILRMDAESMSFQENSFDFVWSWGVIHHSSNTRRILEEIHRVLRPGGQAIIMVYHRGLWNYYLREGLLRGLQERHLFKTLSLHKSVQLAADGAIARYYSKSDWTNLVADLFRIKQIKVMGNKMDLLLLPAGNFKNRAAKLLPNGLARLMTSGCRMGSFLVSVIEKPHSK